MNIILNNFWVILKKNIDYFSWIPLILFISCVCFLIIKFIVYPWPLTTARNPLHTLWPELSHAGKLKLIQGREKFIRKIFCCCNFEHPVQFPLVVDFHPHSIKAVICIILSLIKVRHLLKWYCTLCAKTDMRVTRVLNCYEVLCWTPCMVRWGTSFGTCKTWSI